MVDKDVAGAVVFEVGDLQTVGVSDFLGLEGGIDGVHFEYCFGFSGLQQEREVGGRARAGMCVCVLVCDVLHPICPIFVEPQ